MPIGPNTTQTREVQWPVWSCLICEAEKIAKSITITAENTVHYNQAPDGWAEIAIGNRKTGVCAECVKAHFGGK